VKFKRNHLLISVLSALFVLSVSCADQPMDIQKKFSSSALDADKKMYDPSEGVLTLKSRDVLMQSLEGSDGIRVPTFDILIDKAEFVGVIRCKADYKLVSSTGETLDELGKYTKYDDMKWMWNRASGEFTACKFLGTHVYRTKIQDVAASSGSYYYIINPCISKSRSKSGREGCSNDLKVTNTITFESELKESFVDAAQKLSELEIEVGGSAANIKSLAEVIEAEQQACEKVAAIRASSANFFRGIASLAGAAVGGVVGSIMGGPVGAVKGATSFMGIARDLVNQYGPKVKMDCSGADQYRAELMSEVERMEETVELVIAARNEMSALNGSYRKLNEGIESETSPR
jgi:hypothetical protein